MAAISLTVNEQEVLSSASDDPNLAGITTIEELHSRLSELSIELVKKDGAASAYKKIDFKGTNPNPKFVPNAFKASKGVDGHPIASYYRYAVQDEAMVAKAVGTKTACFSGPRSSITGQDGSGPAAPAPSSARPASGRFGAARKGVKELIESARAGDPAVTELDFTGQATFQMHSEAKMMELTEALKGASPSPIKTLILKNCGIMDAGAAVLGDFLATNPSIQVLDLSENGSIKEKGGVALAKGLASNTALVEVNLMGLTGGVAIRSEAICAAFIDCFQTNVSLKKPIWRLDHPLAHTLARLVTRNTSIARCAAKGEPFEHLLPDDLKNTGIVVHGALASGGFGGLSSAAAT